jgi:hypothetical protein
VSLKDRVVRALALRWLRGKVAHLRGDERETTMGKVLRALDGWKLVIGVLLVFGVSVYDQTQNGHAGNLLGAILAVLGWAPAADWLAQIKEAGPAAVVLIGFLHKLWKAGVQKRAGAAASQLLSTEGYVKAAEAVKAASHVTPPVVSAAKKG